MRQLVTSYLEILVLMESINLNNPFLHRQYNRKSHKNTRESVVGDFITLRVTNPRLEEVKRRFSSRNVIKQTDFS